MGADGTFTCPPEPVVPPPRRGSVAVTNWASDLEQVKTIMLGRSDGRSFDARPYDGWSYCVLHDDGRVHCEGMDLWMGTRSADNPQHDAHHRRQVIQGSGSAVALAVGSNHACVLTDAGTVTCWGDNSNGSLGDGGRRSRVSARPVPGLADVAEVVAGAAHTCARDTDGLVHCWGFNRFYAAGDGTRARRRTRPVRVAGLDDAVDLATSAGAMQTCALRRGGEVVCWGAFGVQVGDHWGGPDALFEPIGATPTELPPLSGVTALAVSAQAMCALRADRTVWCWNYDPTREGFHMEAAHQIPGLTDVEEIAVDGRRLCARRQSGALLCTLADWRGAVRRTPRHLTLEAPPSACAPSACAPSDLEGCPSLWSDSTYAARALGPAGECSVRAQGRHCLYNAEFTRCGPESVCRDGHCGPP